jgi:hypothetical protein
MILMGNKLDNWNLHAFSKMEILNESIMKDAHRPEDQVWDDFFDATVDRGTSSIPDSIFLQPSIAERYLLAEETIHQLEKLVEENGYSAEQIRVDISRSCQFLILTFNHDDPILNWEEGRMLKRISELSEHSTYSMEENTHRISYMVWVNELKNYLDFYSAGALVPDGAFEKICRMLFYMDEDFQDIIPCTCYDEAVSIVKGGISKLRRLVKASKD